MKKQFNIRQSESTRSCACHLDEPRRTQIRPLKKADFSDEKFIRYSLLEYKMGNKILNETVYDRTSRLTSGGSRRSAHNRSSGRWKASSNPIRLSFWPPTNWMQSPRTSFLLLRRYKSISPAQIRACKIHRELCQLGSELMRGIRSPVLKEMCKDRRWAEAGVELRKRAGAPSKNAPEGWK